MKNLLLSRIGTPVCSAMVTMAILTGCGDGSHDHDHPHDADHGHAHAADHLSPHNGTPVLIAEDKFHLELVADSTSGKMQAYVLDGHLEDYVKVSEEGFQLIAKAESGTMTLEFKRIPDMGPAGTTGSSSLFEAEAEWVKSVKTFEGTISSVTLGGTTFTNITFSFPKGTKHVH